jgi:hypothetical protein
VGFSTASRGLGRVNRSRTAFAKTILVFFAVLFVAVLIHPDVDLLDVHDVRISNSRSQMGSVAARFVQPTLMLFARPQLDQGSLLTCLRFAQESVPSSDPSSASILRI